MVGSFGEKVIEYITIDEDSENDENCPPGNKNHQQTVIIPKSEKTIRRSLVPKTSTTRTRRRSTSEIEEPLGALNVSLRASTLRKSQHGSSEAVIQNSKKREMSVICESAKKRRMEDGSARKERRNRRNSASSSSSFTVQNTEKKENDKRRSLRAVSTFNYREEESADENELENQRKPSVRSTAPSAGKEQNIPIRFGSISESEVGSKLSIRKKSIVSSDSSKQQLESTPFPKLIFGLPNKAAEEKPAPPKKLMTSLRNTIERCNVDWKESVKEYGDEEKVGIPIEVEASKKKSLPWTQQPVQKNNACFGYIEELGSVSSLSSTTSSKNGALGNRIVNVPHSFSYYKPDSEAARGDTNGSFKMPVHFPAIPYKKFGIKDMNNYGQGDKDWSVQAVYQTSTPNQFLVIYEGWSSETADVRAESELKKTAPKMLQTCKQRAKIVKALEQKTGKSFSPDLEKLRYNPKAGFWLMEDISFFHNTYLMNHSMAPVFYFSSDPLTRKFPTHTFLHRNVVDEKARRVVTSNPKAKHIDAIIDDARSLDPKFFENITRSSPCSSRFCKCDIRDALVYQNSHDTKTAVRMMYDEKGKLMVQDKGHRYLIECSDACKCEPSCPTRTLQRGQKIPLVVSYENEEKGFGVRAGKAIEKGQFIAEYTGLVRLLEDRSYKNDTYLAECCVISPHLSIDALEKGNVTRFINHSCSGNTMFIAAHSRVREDNPLMPRIGVFAIKDIEMGDEITLSYYDKDRLEEAAKVDKNRVECRCNSEACLGWIPTL